MSSNQITKRTLQDRETLKNKSVYSVPDNPSNKGFSAHQLKSKIADPTLLLFDWVKQLSEESFESFENFGSRLEETVREAADKIYDDDFIAGHQATATVVRDALTNLNGRNLSAFEATLTTVVGGYTVYVITKGGNKLNEEQAKDYLEYMTGSRFLPLFEYEKPQNSMWIMADGSFWKPQYDNNNGMLLFAIPSPFELKANKVNSLSNENTNNQYPSAKAVYDAITAVKKNSFRSVDTTTYATEEAFLESNGEEGYMYLYPKDTSDLSKGYHQYIWEIVNNAGVWIYMGDTGLDLTPYVDKTSNQTITGEKTFSKINFNTNDSGATNWSFQKDGLNQIGIYSGSVRVYSFQGGSFFTTNPNGSDLGRSSNPWTNEYLKGSMLFGFDTTSYTMTERNWKIFHNNYNELVISRTYNSIEQEMFFFNGATFYSKGTNPTLGMQTRKWKEGWIENFKGVVTMTQAQYDALVAAGTVDADTLYFIEEE